MKYLVAYGDLVNVAALGAFALRKQILENALVETVASAELSILLLTLAPLLVYGAAQNIRAARQGEHDTTVKKVIAGIDGVQTLAFGTALSAIAYMVVTQRSLFTSEDLPAKVLVGTFLAGYAAWLVNASLQLHQLRKDPAAKLPEKVQQGAHVAGTAFGVLFAGLGVAKMIFNADLLGKLFAETSLAGQVVGSGIPLAAAAAFGVGMIATLLRKEAQASTLADPLLDLDGEERQMTMQPAV